MKEAQLIVDGKTINITISDEELAKLQPPKPKKTGYESVNKQSTYFYIKSDYSVTYNTEENDNFDNALFAAANYFSDKDVTKDMARAQRLWNQIHRRAVELCDPVYASKEGTLYQIVFMTISKNIIPLSKSVTRSFGTVWFDTEEHCQQVIDEFRDELMWYFTEFRDRADM